MAITVQRAHERFVTQVGWLDSRHNFNFGTHHRPGNDRHGLLIVNNDDRVAPASGFGTHGHRDMEIVTWVLSGRLEHRDSAGHHGVLYPGLAQGMSAGTGIRHSEMNPSPDEAAHFVQMWVLPDANGVAPGYEQADVNDGLARGGLVAVAGGEGSGSAIHINQRGAVLWVGRLAPGESVAVPDSRHAHVFVAIGAADLAGGGSLAEGDAARLTAAGSPLLTAGPAGTEVLVWATA